MTSDISYKTHILVGVRPNWDDRARGLAIRAAAGRSRKGNQRGAQRLCDVRALHAHINNAGERRWRAEERVMGTRPARIKYCR